MKKPGARYLELARRCRANAAVAGTELGKAGLVRMADAYDRRADAVTSLSAEAS